MAWPAARQILEPFLDMQTQGLSYLATQNNGYVLAGIFAVAFPLLRVLLDTLVFGVG